MKNIREKLIKEMEAVKYEVSVLLPQEIKKARELGDLSENAEYQAAKERQRLLQARMAHLAGRISALSMVNLDRIPHDSISYGSTVHLYDPEADKEIIYTLVSSEESDVKAGLISTSSPIGRCLMEGWSISTAFRWPTTATTRRRPAHCAPARRRRRRRPCR